MLRKTAIITGASIDGIGGATALKFARMGYNVGITYAHTEKHELIEKIKAMGVDVLSVKMDITDVKSIEDGFDVFFKHFEYIDAIICNAGVCEEEVAIMDMDIAEIDRSLNTNLRGTILCNRKAIQYFSKNKRGNIVNVASILGIDGCACESVYSATKAGIINLTKSLSKEVGSFGIRVNAVAPGFIDTKMVEEFNEEERNVIIDKTILGRLGRAEDVANGIFFLASTDASFITGEVISISGGLKF